MKSSPPAGPCRLPLSLSCHLPLRPHRPTPTSTSTLTPSDTPQPTATAQPTPAYAVIRLTYRRRGTCPLQTRVAGQRIAVLINGTLVQVLPEIQSVDGRNWVHVRWNNMDGWVLTTVLVATTATPPAAHADTHTNPLISWSLGIAVNRGRFGRVPHTPIPCPAIPRANLFNWSFS